MEELKVGGHAYLDLGIFLKKSCLHLRSLCLVCNACLTGFLKINWKDSCSVNLLVAAYRNSGISV